jgi:hypothetical protein
MIYTLVKQIRRKAIMYQMYVNSLLRVIHIHDLLLVLFRSSTRMFVALRTLLIWNDQISPNGGEEGVKTCF